MSIIPLNDGVVYLAGTSVGLFATTSLDSTATVWVQQGKSTIGNAVVDMVDFRSTDGTVVVATHSHGIYSTKIQSVNDLGISPLVPLADLQFSSYPNPFTNTATLRFMLSTKTKVSLQISDALGRTISTPVNAELAAGEHRYELTTSGFPPGVYYGTLRAGSTSTTRKMLKL